MSEEWVPYNQRERLSVPHLLGISANQLASNLIWTPIGLLINPMCTLFGVNNVYTTLIILIGPIAGLIVPPLVGAASDATMMKWGRRRIWIVIGEALAFVGLMFLAFCDRMSTARAGQITCLVLGQLLASIGGNIFNGPGRVMCTDLTPEHQQVMMSNFCQVHAGIAGVLSNLIGALKLYEYAGMDNAQFVLMISCIIGVISLIISVVVSHEEPLKEKPAAGKNAFLLVVESFKLYDLALWLVGIGFFLFQLGSNQYNTQIGNFMGMNVFGGNPDKNGPPEELKKYNDGVSHSQMLALIQTIVQVCFSFGSTAVTSLLGLPGTWAFGLASGAVAQILYFFVMNRWVYVICAVLWSFNIVIGNSIPYSVLSLYASKETMAGMMAVMVFLGNVGGLLSNFCFTMGLGSIDWFKSNPGRLIGITVIFTILGCVIGLFGIRKTQTEIPELDEDNVDGETPEDPIPVA